MAGGQSDQSDALAIHKITSISSAFTSILNTLIKYGALTIICYFGYKSIESLSGKYTIADIFIQFLGDFEVNESVAYIFGGSAAGYGYAQRNLRKKKVAELTGRIKKLEEKIDPSRTSSHLPPTGDTKEEDLE